MKGRCHCGLIRFEVECSPQEVMPCNNSTCSRKAVNVRCLDDIELAALNVNHFDGRAP